MKISAASLLLAFAGLLQESKCMYSWEYVPPVSNEATGTIDVKLHDGHELTETFVRAHQEAAWLMNPPSQDFQHYAIYIFTFFHGSHEATYARSIAGHRPTAVTITLGELKFKGEWRKNSVFHPYDQEAYQSMHTVNRVYIGVQGTREIWYASLVADVPPKVVQKGPILMTESRYGKAYRHE